MRSTRLVAGKVSKISLLVIAILLTSTVGTFLYIVLLLHLAFRSFAVSEGAFRDQLINTTNACLDVVQEVGAVGLVFSIIFTALVIYLLFKVVVSFVRTLLWYQQTLRSIRTIEVVEKEGHRIIFKADTPIAFTAGLFHPNIFISSWLIENLDEDELSALILHEEYHRKNLHPMMILVDRFITGSIPFYNGSRSFRSLLEVAADSYVRKNLGSSLPLLLGLKKGLERSSQFHNEDLAIASYSFANIRISSLIDATPRLFYIRTLFGAFSTLLVIPALLLLLNFQSSVGGVYAASDLPVSSQECKQYNEINMSSEVQTLERFFTPAGN